VVRTTKVYNKYKVDDRGYAFTAPYNAPVGFSERHCSGCGYLMKGKGVFATGAKIVYTEYDYEYQPFEMECLKNIWMECTNCDENQYS